jgi:hypothetical protein
MYGEDTGSLRMYVVQMIAYPLVRYGSTFFCSIIVADHFLAKDKSFQRRLDRIFYAQGLTSYAENILFSLLYGTVHASLRILIRNNAYFAEGPEETFGFRLFHLPLVQLSRTIISFLLIMSIMGFILSAVPVVYCGLKQGVLRTRGMSVEVVRSSNSSIVQREEESALGPFGPITKIWTKGLQGFWSNFWHQYFRPWFVSRGKINIKHKVPRASTALIKRLRAFATTGAIHAAASYATRADVYGALRVWCFFLAQPALLYLQEQNAGRFMGGYLTLFGLLLSAPWLTDDLASCGLWSNDFIHTLPKIFFEIVKTTRSMLIE